MHPIEQKLTTLGIVLPTPAAPVAAYVPFVAHNGLLFIAGQLPREGDKVAVTGLLGGGVDVVAGQRAARLCAIHLIAQIKVALGGDWSRFERMVRVGGFVACTPDFADHSKVINGASELFLEVFGDAGKHARAAVGNASLPMGAAVEVEAVVALH